MSVCTKVVIRVQDHQDHENVTTGNERTCYLFDLHEYLYIDIVGLT